MRRLKNVVLITGINLIILVLLLKIADGFFAETEPDFRFQYRTIQLTEYPANADFSVYPPDHVMETVQDLEYKEYRLRTDPNGFIIGEDDLNHFGEPIDILFFGGSTTECFFVEEDKRFPYLSGRLMSEKYGERISVRNAGLMGKNTLYSTMDLLVRGTQTDPKIVVLLHNINDLVQLLYVKGYFDGPDTRRLISEPEPEVKRGLVTRVWERVKNSLFPNIYREISETFFTEETTVDEWEGWRDNVNVDIEDVKSQFRSALKSFVSISRSYGYEVVLMTQFNRLVEGEEYIRQGYYSAQVAGLSHSQFFGYYHEFNQVIRDVSIEMDTELIDLAVEIPSTREYMYDGVHLNTAGSILASEIIAESILELYSNLN